MPNYIALLRGINVSGTKKIKMAELRQQLADWGFAAAKTYIQSGNIVFQSDESDTSLLAERLHQKIKEAYDYDVPVLVKTKAEWKRIIEQNPFIEQAEVDIKECYVTLLASTPDEDKLATFQALHFEGEYFQYIENKVYLRFPNGAGRAKLSNNLIESKLKVRATTRNWKTTLKLWEMLNE